MNGVVITKQKNLTFVTGGAGKATAGGTLASSDLKEEAIMEEKLVEQKIDRNFWVKPIRGFWVLVATEVKKDEVGRQRVKRDRVEDDDDEEEEWWRLKLLILITVDIATFISLLGLQTLFGGFGILYSQFYCLRHVNIIK